MTTRASRACDEPETSAALRRYLFLSVGCLVLGLIIFVPTLLISLRIDSATEQLWTEGLRVDGVVTQPFSSSFLSDRNASIQVEFELDGATRRETIRLDSDMDSYELGQRLDVIVDPADPERVILDEQYNSSRSRDNVEGALMTVGGLLVVVGAATMPRWLRWQRHLRTQRWRSASVTCHGEIGPMRRMVVFANGPQRSDYYAVAITTPARHEALRAGEVWAADAGRRRLVLAVEDGATLFDCFLPRTAWGRRRLARRVEEAQPPGRSRRRRARDGSRSAG